MSSEQYGLIDTGLKTIIAISAMIAALMAWRAKRAVQEVHVALNSRLTQLLEMTTAASLAAGRDSMREGDGLDAGKTGPSGPAGIQGPIGPQGQVGPAGVQGERAP